MDISRVDPLDVGRDLAERLAAVERASLEHARLEVPPTPGPSLLSELRLGNNGRPVDGLWIAGPLADPAGWCCVQLPWLDNLDSAHVRGMVVPPRRRDGIGSALLTEALDAVSSQRSTVFAGTWADSPGTRFLEEHGFTTAGQHRYDVRRLDLSDGSRWDELYDEAAAAAAAYEVVRVTGPAAEELLPGLVRLHEAINDAPTDEGQEPDVWDAERLRGYDTSMARRGQTTYRILARHLPTGDWAGMSLLCVDEAAPSVAFQEDTNVVGAHRGNRLGLLMKCEMLRWIAAERPEVTATDTWNATDNDHMVAVNVRLGCRTIATHVGFRRSQ